jgi:hypothetical protein
VSKAQLLHNCLILFCFSLDISISDNVPMNLMCDDEEVVSTNNMKNENPEVLQVKANERMGRTCGGNMADGFFIGNIMDKKVNCSVVELHPVDRVPGQSTNFKQKKSSSRMSEICSKMANVMLTKYEIEGLRAVVKWLKSLPTTKKGVPKDIPNPDQLLKDAQVS